MNQLDIFSTPVVEQTPVPPPVEAPRVITQEEIHLQKKADFYLGQMNQLATLCTTDHNPQLSAARRAEMSRLAELRKALLNKLETLRGP